MFKCTLDKQLEETRNPTILHCVFHASISLLCYSAAHWETSSEDCVLEKHAVFMLDAGLMDDLRGSSG